jgi:hypothetical protein
MQAALRPETRKRSDVLVALPAIETAIGEFHG